jgi:NAD(P)-dependent dehydrogenase (short-subunit alcohol dehydrogenase family)
MKDAIVQVGAGQIGQAIARRVGVWKHVLLADKRPENADAEAEALANAGIEVSVATVNVASRDAFLKLAETASKRGAVTGLIQAPGVSLEAPTVGRARTPDEVASVASLLMGPEGGFITGRPAERKQA